MQGDLTTGIRDVIAALGDDPSRSGLKDTPRRVFSSLRFLTSGYQQSPEAVVTLFDSDGFNDLIVVKDVEFYSLCEHHMLPFFGTVSVGYVPDAKIIGLSKIPRIVQVFSRRLQVQERFTKQVAEAVMSLTHCRFVGVCATAKHLCVAMRGVENEGATTDTSYYIGDSSFKSEFIQRTK